MVKAILEWHHSITDNIPYRCQLLYDHAENRFEIIFMNKPKSKKQNTEQPVSDKTDRLAQALRENLLKRKSQKRGRTNSPPPPPAGKGEPDHG